MFIDQKMIGAVQEVIKTFGVRHIVMRAELLKFLGEKYHVVDGSVITIKVIS